MKHHTHSFPPRTPTGIVGSFAAAVAVLALVILTSPSSLQKAQAAEEGLVNTH